MFVKVNNGQAETYPHTIGRLRRDHPNTSFPKRLSDELLAEYDLYRVDSEPQPVYDDKTERVAQDSMPTLIDGKWVIGWTVYQKEQEQIDRESEAQAESIRSQRNDLLAKCDWTVLADSPLTEEKRAEWLTYRQALRDISDLEAFPYVDLPNDPDFVEVTDDPASSEI
jgi:hypothetical protein